MSSRFNSAIPAVSSAVAGSSRSHSGRRDRARRANPRRRRCPCERARAGRRAWRSSETLASASRSFARFHGVAGQRDQRARFSSAVSSSFNAGRWPPYATSSRRLCANGATSTPRQRTLPANGAPKSGQNAQQRGLARAVGAGHEQRAAGLDAEGQRRKEARRTAPRGQFNGFEHGTGGKTRRASAGSCGRLPAIPRGALKTRAIIAGRTLPPVAAGSDCYGVRAMFLTRIKEGVVALPSAVRPALSKSPCRLYTRHLVRRDMGGCVPMPTGKSMARR